MSSAASTEAAWANTDIIRTIDETMMDVARQMPRDAFYWIPDQYLELASVEGVGQLECWNVGRYAVAVTAETTDPVRPDFTKEYYLIKRHTEADTPQQIHDFNPLQATDFYDDAQATRLLQGVTALRQAYLDRLAARHSRYENVVDLAQYRSA